VHFSLFFFICSSAPMRIAHHSHSLYFSAHFLAAALFFQKMTTAEQEKEFAKVMLSNKKRHLYEKMQYGINKKSAVAETLERKRELLEQKAAATAAAAAAAASASASSSSSSDVGAAAKPKAGTKRKTAEVAVAEVAVVAPAAAKAVETKKPAAKGKAASAAAAAVAVEAPVAAARSTRARK
jgi:hypothetical protein